MELFDAHLHIIDSRFPLIENQGYIPDYFSCKDYLKRTSEYNIIGGAVVSGSFQGFDQTYLLAALNELGPSFCGGTQIPVTTTDEEILQLNDKGVRAVRFNLKRGGGETLQNLDRVAHRVYELAGWHSEIYVDSAELAGLYNTIMALPCVSIDHLGISADGFKTLLQLVERGVHVKATGFGRVNFDIRAALRNIYAANPDSLMFGTDLPSTRAPRPFEGTDISTVTDVLDEAGSRKVFYENALHFYRKVNIIANNPGKS